MTAASQRFRRCQHLRQARAFHAVRREGRARTCGPFLLQVRIVPDQERAPLRRLGVIASRRVGNAVARNLCKRRLRELFRRNQEQLPGNCDVVLVARRSLLDTPFADVEACYLRALARWDPCTA